MLRSRFSDELVISAAQCAWGYEEKPMPFSSFSGANRGDFASVLWDRCVVGLASVGLDGEWIKANPALCDLLEYTESELQSRTFQSITHPDDVNDDVVMLERIRDGRLDHYVMSKRYITKRGSVIWIKLRVHPIRGPDESITFFLSQIVPAKEIGSMGVSINKETGRERFNVVTFFRDEWKWLLAAVIAAIGFIVQQHALQIQTSAEISANRDAIRRIEKVLDSISTKLEPR